MKTFNSVSELVKANLRVGDTVQVMSTGNSYREGTVYPHGHHSSNRVIKINNGVSVELLPTLIIGGSVRKYVKDAVGNTSDIFEDEIKSDLYDMHTGTGGHEWTSGMRVYDDLHIYVVDGKKYMANIYKTPFTSGSSFAEDLGNGLFTEVSLPTILSGAGEPPAEAGEGTVYFKYKE